MQRRVFFRSIVFSLIMLLMFISCETHKTQHLVKDWKEESKKIAEDFARDLGAIYPEDVADIGFDEFGSKSTHFSGHMSEDHLLFLEKWQNQLENKLEKNIHHELRTDLMILLEKVRLDKDQIKLERSVGEVPFIPITEFIYLNIKEYLAPDAGPLRKNQGLTRFQSYVRGSSEHLPLALGVEAFVSEKIKYLKIKKMTGFWPSRYELEIYLKESEKYLKAIRGLLANSKDEWQKDLLQLETQDQRFRSFLKEKVLPFSRTRHAVPDSVYASILRSNGIKMSARELIKTGLADYQKTYVEFKNLAKEVALKYRLRKNDPVSVVKFLSSRKIQDPDDLVKSYRNSISFLYEIILKNHLLTIQNKPEIIVRFATPAEAQSIPAPHFIASPILGEDRDLPSQFVITPANKGRSDFSYPEAIVNLSAHEAVPGHGLQFQVMRERGTTLIRSWLAFNSANVEGWALYAEEMVHPYLNIESKFISLQRRLWRQARMFLDPQLNLDMINEKRVNEVFSNELGFSPLFARSEYDRYSYIMPGQAPSYYYGYKRLTNLRSRIQHRYNHLFKSSCFNDAVLNLGVLPLDEIESRLTGSFQCDLK